ncbi:MAG: hypothetical protein PHO37_03440 [Kiritimatiellae bacterium]|nr:hypothetical protein [Kiritimatiellia bacterium]
MKRILCLVLGMTAGLCLGAELETLVDFTQADHGWRGNHFTRVVEPKSPMTVELIGEDPWIEGPAIAVSSSADAKKLLLTLHAESPRDGACQLFYAAPGQHFSEGAAVYLRQLPESRSTYQGIIPLVTDTLRFRIDPPGSSGIFTLRSLQALPLTPLTALPFTGPSPVLLSELAPMIEAGNTKVIHDATRWNTFAVFINGHKMAESNPAESVVYWDNQQAMTVLLSETTVEQRADGFTVSARGQDQGGALWQISRVFTVDRNAVRIETTLSVSEPRQVVHLPWLTLFAGVGSFGESKSQALLPGVEYLANEPSSNEKEIRGTAANRRITAAYKSCFPMMAIAADGHWLAVDWQQGELPASPLFDSPDRLFHSGGHVFGLWSPAVGEHRFEGETAVYGSIHLAAGHPYHCAAAVRGGQGDVVTEAIGGYVARFGLPPLPEYTPGFEGAVRLLAGGWLDSSARHNTKWRHAVWGEAFPSALAEDVPAYLLWLAAHAPEAALKQRLQASAREVIAALPPGNPGINGVSHVNRITGALLYGGLERLVAGAAGRVKARAAQLAQTGGVARYTATPGKPDYASTLGSDHCNGFTAMSVEKLMQDASLTGDQTAIAAALSALDQMTAHYAGEVPRGAQPWEMPLHTPDIVAAARLLRCYVLGYQLSNNTRYLEQARYWAWSGVSMVYLAPPTAGPVGLYGTIGVIGATNWHSPNWIGQPVQWCGLVYRSALADLARVDAAQGALWQQLAGGITISGLQMCFPLDDPEQRGGLLPDYFLLQAQKRDGPAINPGTLQAHLAEAYGKTPMYTLTRLANGVLVHAPGTVVQEQEAETSTRITITAWPEEEYRILITGIAGPPAKIMWNNAPVAPRFLNEACAMIVPLKGCGTLELEQ